MDFRRRGMIAIPCAPYCPDRSAECHATCDKYKAYRAEMDAQCAIRADCINGLYISKAKEQSRRKQAARQMAGRR